ncbi:hypothetical protein BKM15_26175 [Pseudomonas syringae pv. syringae]|nr:hypothetical protein BKM15_26175 [Pseudomonas syringae pv. syringae]
MPSSIFFYLCDCHDAGFLPSEDKMTDRYPDVDFDDLERYMKRFVAVHYLDGIDVQWEGVIIPKQAMSY